MVIHITEYRNIGEVNLNGYKRTNLLYDSAYESERQCLFIHNSIEDY